MRQRIVSSDPLAPKKGILAGAAAGMVGIFCCVGPAAAALLGFLSAESAIDLATDLYGDWAWAFRLAGAAASVALIVLARRRAACALGAPALKRFVSVLVVSALVTYGILYAVTTWLGNIADGSGGSNGSAPAALSESASADSEPESALDRLRRLSGQACTPSRNH